MRARAFSLSVAFLAAATLVAGSGAATTKGQAVTRIDVSTRASVVQYLRSIHVNPAGVVIQRGAHNYAGPSCPGRGWSCTTTDRPVVQVATAGGNNTFSCDTASCAVVQVAAAPTATPNTAKCIKTTGLGQSCTISQSSATRDNLAVVYENTVKTSGLTQTASFTASITQQATGTSNSNTACVTQGINIDGSTVAKKGTPVNVNLEAHQTVNITQDALGSGGNSASLAATSAGNCDTTHSVAPSLAQTQTLTSKASGSGTITQNENAVNGGANMTIDVEQNLGSGNGVGSGPNTADFVQTNRLTAVANSLAGSISQTQSSVNGGLLGTVNQDSSGLSTATTTQNETLCEDAATGGLTSCDTADADASEAPASLTQIQYGPVQKGVGQATQTGNDDDTFSVVQTSTQDNDQGAGSQQTNVVHGDCHTSGTCTVDQTTNIDGQTTENTQTGQNVDSTTTCTGSDCTATPTNVLIAGSGNFGNTEANDNIAAALTSAGYTVTELPTLPADLSSFGQVWRVDDTPPTAAEQTQLVDFANSGKGVFLTGENVEFFSGEGSLNAADQSMVNSIVTGGGITVGGEDVCCAAQTIAYPVNATVVGDLATQPHAITDWTATYPGTISGMADSSVFAYYQATETTQTVAAAWDRASTVGNGRLVLFMDINWAETSFQGANFSDVAENVAFFLSGLSSPPSPILLAGPFAATEPLGAGTFVIQAGAVSPSARSGATIGTR
jgi:hypothetical protein